MIEPYPAPAVPPASGRRERRNGRDYVVYTRRLQAPGEVVWRALTDPDELARWVGRWQWADDGEGRVIELTFVPSAPGVVPVPLELESVDEGRRVTLLMHEPGRDEPWRLEVELVAEGNRTVLILAQSIVNQALAPSVGSSTEYYLDRLAALVQGEDQDALDVDDYFLGQAKHYRELFPMQRRRDSS